MLNLRVSDVRIEYEKAAQLWGVLWRRAEGKCD